jgi:hypothetical protein
MPATFDKILGKPLLHTHTVSDITDFSQSNSSSSDVVVSVSSDQTLTSSGTANVYLVDTSSADINVTLPTASTVTNKIYKIKKTDSSTNNIVIKPNETDTIENLSENLIIQFQNSAVQLISYGNGWFII